MFHALHNKAIKPAADVIMSLLNNYYMTRALMRAIGNISLGLCVDNVNKNKAIKWNVTVIRRTSREFNYRF